MSENDPWSQLKAGMGKRVSKSGNFDFFWTKLSDGSPALMLKLPSLPEANLKLPKFKNLNVVIHGSGDPALVIILEEKEHLELFETLCKDVVSSGEQAGNVAEALTRTLQRTRRWHHLLRGGSRAGLSVEEQRGLVGELAQLRDLLEGLGAETAIDSWKGPDQSNKDFQFIGTCIEVKTRNVISQPSVTINSEEQLADVEGARLFLRIFDVSSSVSTHGDSLHDHVAKTAKFFEESSAAFDAWEQALFEYGYDSQSDYDDRSWKIEGSHLFEVLKNFPRIGSPLPNGVSRVKYALSLSALSEFESLANLVSIVREGMSND